MLKPPGVPYKMWPHEDHFCASAQKDAEVVFGLLGFNLYPLVLLVGVKADVDTPGESVVVCSPSPELQPSQFVELRGVVDRFGHSTRGRFHQRSEAARGRLPPDSEFLDDVTGALYRDVGSQDPRDGHVSYTGDPVLVWADDRAYWVSIVLRFRADAVNSHGALTSGIAVVPSIGPRTIARSLPEAVAGVFLNAAPLGLRLPNPDGDLFSHSVLLGRDPHELVRVAGQLLLLGPEWESAGVNGQTRLFDACTGVAAQAYEKHEPRGTIIVARRGHQSVEPALEFVTPVSLESTRAVRKLLETAGAERALLADATAVRGITSMPREYDPSIRQDLFVIRVTARGTWELAHGDTKLMRVEFGMPRLPRPRIDDDVLDATLDSVFGSVDATPRRRLHDLARWASAQERGTTLAIVRNAAAEAERLAAAGVRVVPCELTEPLLSVVSLIDGAVLVDADGTCHAIGVILDGDAASGGETSGRGARFNSAVRYVEHPDRAAVALVVSADGTVDVVCAGRHQPDKTALAFRRLRAGRNDDSSAATEDGPPVAD